MPDYVRFLGQRKETYILIREYLCNALYQLLCLICLATTPSAVTSTYTGVLSSRSSTFVRPGSNSGDYYYQAFRVTVSVSGPYVFTSSSSIDTYGCLYNDPFNPYSPSFNLIISDDDGGGNTQFRINTTLQFGRTYILVVTTYRSSDVGSFSISVGGRGSVTLTSIAPLTSK